MPEGRAIEFVFPFKGAHTASPRQAQPEGTVPPEALSNVMPWDRSGRMRGASRPGTARLIANAIGNGNQPVQYLGYATIALDPATITPNVQLVNLNFANFAGTKLENIGGALTTFKSYGNNSGFMQGLGNNHNASVLGVHSTGNIVAENENGVTLDGASIYQPNLTLGTAYVVRGYIIPVGASSNYRNGTGFLARVNLNTIAAGEGMSLALFTDQIQLVPNGSNTPAASYTFPTAISGQQYVEMRVNGNVFQAWMNGVKLCQATFASNTANVGVGLFAALNVVNAGPATFEVWTGTTLTSYRQTTLVAVCGGSIYAGDLTSLPLATGGTSVLNGTGLVCAASGQGAMYFVDGFSIVKLDLATRTVVAYAATAGTLPTNVTGVVLWRDRLIFYGDRSSPQNFYMSRLGVYTDFDYSQIDPAAAFAGNASTAGHIGDPIVSMIPFADDQLMIAGDHNMWMMRGDPAAGGSIDLMSDAVGILGQFAWCKAPDGTVYFAGTGGLYKVRGEAFEEIISNRFPFFNAIQRTSTYLNLAWDRDRQGMWIMACPVNTSTSLNRNLWYDGRTDGYFPMGLPDAWGPVSMCVYDGDNPGDRALLMGGRGGLIFKLADTAYDDDGGAFNCSFFVGPTKPGGAMSMYGTTMPGSDLSEGIVNQLDVIFGEAITTAPANSFQATVQLCTGHDAYNALNNSILRTKTFTAAGRQTRWITRTRGVSLFLNVTTNSALGKYFSFERATGNVIPAGRERK